MSTISSAQRHGKYKKLAKQKQIYFKKLLKLIILWIPFAYTNKKMHGS